MSAIALEHLLSWPSATATIVGSVVWALTKCTYERHGEKVSGFIAVVAFFDARRQRKTKSHHRHGRA